MSQRPWDREEDDLPEELRPIADMLDGAAKEEQATLREAEAMQDAPGLARVEEVLEREWGSAGGAPTVARPRSGSRRRILGLVGAVAAGIALFVFVRTLRAPDGPGPGNKYLGGDGFQVVSPSGTVEEFTVVEWTHPSAARSTFVVRVLDGEGGRVLLETPRLEGTRYALDAAQVASWPDEITIEIEAYDASNRLEDVTPPASASRSAQ